MDCVFTRTCRRSVLRFLSSSGAAASDLIPGKPCADGSSSRKRSPLISRPRRAACLRAQSCTRVPLNGSAGSTCQKHGDSSVHGRFDVTQLRRLDPVYLIEPLLNVLHDHLGWEAAKKPAPCEQRGQVIRQSSEDVDELMRVHSPAGWRQSGVTRRVSTGWYRPQPPKFYPWHLRALPTIRWKAPAGCSYANPHYTVSSHRAPPRPVDTPRCPRMIVRSSFRWRSDANNVSKS